MLKNCTLIEPFKCEKNSTVVEVAKLLSTNTLRHIFVVDEQDHPVGIISMTDINNRVVAKEKDLNTLAKDIMSSPIEVYDLNDNVMKVYSEMMAKKRVMCAVTQHKKFVGIITINELFNNIARQGGAGSK